MGDKREIRSELKAKRDSLNGELWVQNSNTIQSLVLKSKIYKEADSIFAYSDFHGEVGTLSIIEDALLKGKKVYMPKVLDTFDDNGMAFFRIFSTSELIPGFKGIKEPCGNGERVFDPEKESNDKILMLVPGVAFSTDGYRIGYGRGYYDKYLEGKEIFFKMGLSFSMQVVDNLPNEIHDVKMDLVVTEDSKLQDINKYKF